MRRWLHSQLPIPRGGRVADLGCGAGDDLGTLATTNPQATSFVGVDRGEDWIHRAREETVDPRITYLAADVTERLPFEDASLDAVYSVNLLECLPDPGAFLKECARIVRPGGSVLVAHWDWDTQTFDGRDQALVRRLVHAFNDWQQDWMAAVDPWMGRRLRRLIAESGAFEGEILARTLLDTLYAPGSYGYEQVQAFGALARRGLVVRDEYETFRREQETLAAEGAFFYSVTMFAFAGRRV